MAVPLGSAAFGSFKRRVASFCVAGVALRDILVLCDRHHTFLHRFQKMRFIFRGRPSTSETSIIILRGRPNTLDVSCCVFFASRIVRAASSGDNVQITWQGWHFMTLYTLHSTLYT